MASYSIWNNSGLPFRFRKEIENDYNLAFFFTAVSREPDGRLTTGVYRNPRHTGQYLVYDSYQSQSLQRGFVKCLYERAKRLVTKLSVTSKEKKHQPVNLFLSLTVTLFLSCTKSQRLENRVPMLSPRRSTSLLRFHPMSKDFPNKFSTACNNKSARSYALLSSRRLH